MSYQSYRTKPKSLHNQNEPIMGRESDMVKNAAGGYAFTISDWKRFERFLVIGSDRGTYYMSSTSFTCENALTVESCIVENGILAVDTIVAFSESGRAVKNDPALFALALASSTADPITRTYALSQLSRVARIGTHLFMFVGFLEQFRGWGRAVRDAVRHWYLDKAPGDLVYQVIKYQQRDGWSHRDVLRHVHPKVSGVYQDIFNWVVNGWENVGDVPHPDENLAVIWAVEKIKSLENIQDVCKLIIDYRLPFEAIPTEYLRFSEVWEALLPYMGLTALIRNLGRLTSNGTFDSWNTVHFVVSRLTNQSELHKARIHPISILVALNTYKSGRGLKGSLSWTPITEIVDALDSAFYTSFSAVESTGKRFMLALDVSGSTMVECASGISVREASAAMAMVTAATEQECTIVGFSHELVPLDVSPRRRLDDNVATIRRVPYGRTDCALPMLYALEHKIPVDVFIIYTDNETWYGTNGHPSEVLKLYRKESGIDAKMIVVAMTATSYSIADPNDPGMLDIAGFDASIPQLINAFIY